MVEGSTATNSSRVKKKSPPYVTGEERVLISTKNGKTFQRRKRIASKITPEQRRLLVEAWGYEWPDDQACVHAGLTHDQLRAAYTHDRSLMSTRDHVLKRPEYTARRNIVRSLEEGDLRTSRWFLERRVKEFAAKSSMDIAVNHTLTIEQIEDKLLRLMGRSNTELLECVTDQVEEYHDVIGAELEPVGADDGGGADDTDLDLLLS